MYLWLSFQYCRVCFLQPCGHLLGKGWPLGSLVCDVPCVVFFHFPILCPGSGVVLDCNDSRSLPFYLLGCVFAIHVFER